MKENNFNLKKIREIISFIICGIQHRTANTLKRTNKGIKKKIFIFLLNLLLENYAKKEEKKLILIKKKLLIRLKRKYECSS